MLNYDISLLLMKAELSRFATSFTIAGGCELCHLSLFFFNYSSLGGTSKQTTVDAKWRVLARSQSALLKYAWHTLGLSFDGYSDVLELEPEVVLVKQEVIDLDLDQGEEEVVGEGAGGGSQQAEGSEDFVIEVSRDER